MSWPAENAMVGAAVVSWFEEETVGVITVWNPALEFRVHRRELFGTNGLSINHYPH